MLRHSTWSHSFDEVQQTEASVVGQLTARITTATTTTTHNWRNGKPTVRMTDHLGPGVIWSL